MSNNNAEADFKARYITTPEILKRLRIARSTLLLARRTGRLPGGFPIYGQLYVWERAGVEPYLQAWELMRSAKGAA